jgi:hypothetical protein
MGWNSIVPQQIPPYHYAPVLEHMKYSVAFQNNFNIMVIFPALALVLYGVYRIVLYLHEKDRIEG